MKVSHANILNRYLYGGMLVILLSLACLSPRVAIAQQSTASVNGAVEDQTGAVVPNAQVKLTNTGTGVVRTTTTNSTGIYTFPSVVPGVYSMQVSAHGFAPQSQPPVTLQVDQVATFDFHLKVGSTSSTVTVTGTPPALETSTAQIGTVVTGDHIWTRPACKSFLQWCDGKETRTYIRPVGEWRGSPLWP